MADNILVNFLFAGSAGSLVSSSQQAVSALGRVEQQSKFVNVGMVTAAAGLGIMAAGLIRVAASAIGVSAEFQRLSTSFVSILAEPLLNFTKGAALTKENLEGLKAASVNLFVEAQRAALDTVATTQEYVNVLQSALAVGQNVGLSQNQIAEITHRLVIAAGQFGIEFEKVGTSIAQIFTGSVRVTNQLGRNLGLTTVEARKLLKEAVANGKLFDFLNERTRQFSVNSKDVANSFLAVKSSIIDIFQVGGTAAVKPLFDFIQEELIKFRDNFVGTGDQFFKPALQGIVKSIQDFLKSIIPALKVLFSEIAKLLEAIGERSGIAAFAFKTIIAGLTIIVKLLHEAVSLQGVGGLIAGFGLVYLAITKSLSALIAIRAVMTTIRAIGISEALRGGAAATATSAAIPGATGAAGALAAFSKAAGIIGIVVGLVLGLKAAYDVLSGSAEKAAAELDAVNDALEKFSTLQSKAAEDTNLRSLIAEFQALSTQQHKSIEDQQRLATVTAILTGTLGPLAFAAMKAGQAVDLVAGQSKLNNDLKTRIDQLKELRENLQTVNQGQPFDTTGGSADTAYDQQVLFEKFFKSREVVLSLSEALGLKLTPAILDNEDATKAQLKVVEDLIDADSKRLDNQDLLTKSTDELINLYIKARTESTSSLEISQKQAAIQGVLNDLLIANAGHNVAAAKASAVARLHIVDDLLKIAEAQQLANLEIVNGIALRDTFALSGQQVDAGNALVAVSQSIDKFKAEQAILQQFIAGTPSKKPGGGGGGRGRDRDELKDFLTLINNQLGLLKKTADGVEKEAGRIITARTNLIHELADAGAISFEQAFGLEEDLIDQGENLQKRLTDIQLDLVRQAQQLAGAVANRTEIAGRRPIGKKGKLPGKDTRDRTTEAVLKLGTDEIDLLNKINDAAIKAEEAHSAAVQRNVTHRIEIRKLERQDLAAAAKQQADLLLSAKESLAEFGVLTQRTLLGARFDASKADIEREVKEIEAQLFPLADDRLANELSAALTKAGIQGGNAPDQLLDAKGQGLKRLDALTPKLNAVKDAMIALAKEVGGSGKKPSSAGGKSIEERVLALNKELSELSAQSPEDIAKIKAIDEALAIVLKSNITDEQKIALEARLRELKISGVQLEIKHDGDLLKINQELLQIKQQTIDFDLQRLDILDQLVQKQREFGILSEAQANAQAALLLQNRINLIGDKRANLANQLATTSANLGKDPDNAGLLSKQLGLQSEINQIGVQVFELKNKLFELKSPLLATRDAFNQIAEATNNLPGPFAKLSGVFKGIAGLAEAIANRSRPKPEDPILTAAQAVEKGGNSFLNSALKAASAIVDAANQFKGIVTGTSVDTNSIGGDEDIINSQQVNAAKEDVKTKAKIGVADIIRGAGAAVSGVLSAIANKDVGQAIAGFGQLAGLIPVAGPFIQAGLEIVGGIVSFFGARAKEKTHEMAVAITQGIDQLKDAISTGAIGLGQGIVELQGKLEEARRQLSGRKGGKEELKKIEDDTQAEIKRLREQAKQIQDDFRAQLELLRQPKALREVIGQIQAINQQAKKFIKSFENPEDALAAVKDAQEFIHDSIQEIKDDIQKTLADLQANLRDAVEKFALDQRDILNEGRIDPAVSQAESKKRRLIELERSFQKQKLDLEAQIAGEQTKLDYVNQRANLEEKIANLAERSAAALGQAASHIADAAAAMERAFAQMGFFPQGTSPGSVTLNLRINDQPVGEQQIGIGTTKHLELAGLLPMSGLSRFNPIG